MPVTIRPPRLRPFAHDVIIAAKPTEKSAAGLIAIAFVMMVVISAIIIAINGVN